MSENSSAMVTTRLVDLSSASFVQPVEILSAATPVYQVIVRRILGRTMPPLMLFFGETGIPMRGQGDSFRFYQGFEGRIRLGFFRSVGLPNFNAAEPGPRNLVEVTFVHDPNLVMDIKAVDARTIAPIYSQFESITAAAAQFPLCSIVNPFDPAVAPSPFAQVWGHVRRLWVTSSIDGNVSIFHSLQNSPVGAPAFPNPGTAHVVDVNPDAVGAGALEGTTATPGALDGGAPLWSGGVKAGDAKPIDIEDDLPPSRSNGKYNALRVFGPGGPSTLTVTFEWHEVEVI